MGEEMTDTGKLLVVEMKVCCRKGTNLGSKKKLKKKKKKKRGIGLIILQSLLYK